MATLRITEIFYSLQGESDSVGWPTVFIRLTGCPLRCHYCDTSYAFQGGKLLSLANILSQVQAFHCDRVCVTGGEPLAQPNCLELLQALCDTGYKVSIETSGALDIRAIDKRVMIVMDFKTPDSGEAQRNMWSNIDWLKQQDQIKFVLSSREDYLWSCDKINQYQLGSRANILFSPSWDVLNPTELASWILADQLPVRLQLQLHKLLWGDARGR